MLDLDTRTAILRLAKEGHSLRLIAKSLTLSRNTVRTVLTAGTKEVPAFERD